MAKLTDPEYFLPVVEALEANKVLSTGRTRPTIIRGVCTTTHVKSEYVVKFNGAPEMYEGASCRELLAALMALELGFNIPDPAIVNISEAFVENIVQSKHENCEIASKSVGFNFGSCYIEGYQEPMRDQTFSDDLLPEFIKLFALDIFWGNPDRRVDKPNFLTNGKNLLIYDHELAFSFTSLIFPTAEPWLIPPTDMDWISNNYCFNVLKGKKIDFSIFANHLTTLDDSFWVKAAEVIPAEWNNGLIEKIKNHLYRILENRNQFATELNRILL